MSHRLREGSVDNPLDSLLMKPHNSSILSSAYSLGVHPDELAQWVEEKNPAIKPKADKADVEQVGNEMARLIEQTNPLLAQRWKLVNLMAR